MEKLAGKVCVFIKRSWRQSQAHQVEFKRLIPPVAHLMILFEREERKKKAEINNKPKPSNIGLWELKREFIIAMHSRSCFVKACSCYFLSIPCISKIFINSLESLATDFSHFKFMLPKLFWTNFMVASKYK